MPLLDFLKFRDLMLYSNGKIFNTLIFYGIVQDFLAAMQYIPLGKFVHTDVLYAFLFFRKSMSFYEVQSLTRSHTYDIYENFTSYHLYRRFKIKIKSRFCKFCKVFSFPDCWICISMRSVKNKIVNSIADLSKFRGF